VDTEKILYLGTSLVSSVVNAFKQSPSKVDSILVVKLDEIGDMVYTLHCIQALHDQFPESSLSVYCKPMNNALVMQTGCVSHVVNEINDLHTKYDIQIDFRGNYETLQRAITGKCDIYLDRGIVRLKNKFTGGQRHEVYTNQETISWLFPEDYTFKKPSFTISETDIHFVQDLVKSAGIDKYVVMHCGARDEARRWPAERFASLIDEIHKIYGLKTVLIGSPNESALNQTVVAQCKNAVNLAGKTSLLQMAAVMRHSAFFVGNESGPLHFAIVEQKPLVALFGPGVKDVFYPLFPNQQVIHHITSGLKGSDDSMQKITVEEVVTVIEQAMHSK